VRVNVTDDDVKRGTLTVPEIAAEVVPIPIIGETLTLAYQRPDGSKGTLSDFRGKFTVVHYWASWCTPCKQQLPALRQVHERFAGRGLTTVGISVDADDAAWQAALKRLGLPWSQGRVAAPAECGISSVPAYWLLDPEGKIIAKVYDPDELAKQLADRIK
jgi:thiol-disulfide isomerase/thioredoxin